ncbi:hypothetical protein EKO04_003336 [Ascochyta lentis]|uniref:Metalloendopeptidase n=1 Tax=Ascochyta lentis TaxID=205686 RepID=A0A8H7MKZ4_9PLEO|nr:hypothetical protein EKO04_003336 [Ascochyta lentis]
MYTSSVALAVLFAMVSSAAAYPGVKPGPIRKLITIDMPVPSGSHRFKTDSVGSPPATKRMSYFVERGLAITHGDVIFATEEDLIHDSNAQRRSLSVFKSDNQSLWPAGRIEYKWESEDAKGMGRLEAWTEATKRWTDMLPFLKFNENEPGESMEDDIVTLVPTEGQGSCYSPIGRSQNSRHNQIMLDNDCGGAGTYTHELGHTLGLYHEHTRPDRDDYVIINCDNVMQSSDGPNDCSENCSGNGCNFARLADDKAKWSGPYDSLSIMHYGPYEFAGGNGPAIVAKDGVTPPPRHHTFPTVQDAKRVCTIYGDDCTGVCGDGVVDKGNGEDCDDGNNEDGDGCSASCKTE